MRRGRASCGASASRKSRQTRDPARLDGLHHLPDLLDGLDFVQGCRRVGGLAAALAAPPADAAQLCADIRLWRARSDAQPPGDRAGLYHLEGPWRRRAGVHDGLASGPAARHLPRLCDLALQRRRQILPAHDTDDPHDPTDRGRDLDPDLLRDHHPLSRRRRCSASASACSTPTWGSSSSTRSRRCRSSSG